MIIVRLLSALVALWVGTTLLIDSRQRRRRRPTLAERLESLTERSLAWETEDWLRHQTLADPRHR